MGVATCRKCGGKGGSYRHCAELRSLKWFPCTTCRGAGAVVTTSVSDTSSRCRCNIKSVFDCNNNCVLEGFG